MGYAVNQVQMGGVKGFSLAAENAPAIKQNLEAIAGNLSRGVGGTSTIAGNASYRPYGGDGAAGASGADALNIATGLVMFEKAQQYGNTSYRPWHNPDTLLSKGIQR